MSVKSMIVWSCAKTHGEKNSVNTLKNSTVNVHSPTKTVKNLGIVVIFINKSNNS